GLSKIAARKIEGDPCLGWQRKWHSLPAVPVVLAQRLRSAWQLMELVWSLRMRKTPARLPLWSRLLNPVEEARSRYKRTQPTPQQSKMRLKRPPLSSADWT